MGLLAIAGMFSGAGHAVNKGLDSMQDDIRRAGLSQEDRAFQLKKLQVQQDFEYQREQRGYTHAEQLQKQNQDFLTTQKEGEHQFQANQDEVKAVRDLNEKGKDRELAGRKLDIESAAQKSLDEYHKMVGSYYQNAKGRGGDAKAYKDLNDSTKLAVEQHGKEAEHFFKLAEGALDDKQKKGYIDAGKAALAKGYALLGETPAEAPGAADLSRDDPFADKSPLSGKAGAPDSAKKGPGLLSKVPSEPTAPPVSYDQRAQEQLQDPRFDRLKRYFEQPTGPPVPPGPGVTLPNAQ